MSVNYLPKEITKDVLYKRALERFQNCTKFYGDPNISAQHLYEYMACSVFSGNPADDFPDEVKKEQDSVIKYQYKDGLCSFMIDGIEVEVQDLRGMRESSRVGKELYADICVLTISYNDEDGMDMCHVVPNTWLYGSSSEEFNEGKPVHQEFIDAAREYIKEHNITKEMQEVQDD